MSLAEKESTERDLDRAEVIRNSAMPIVCADEIRFFVEGLQDSFSAHFPLMDDFGRAARTYFLTLVSAERPISAMNEDGTPKINEDGTPNYLLAAEGKIYLEETHMLDGETVIGVDYAAIRV